MKNLLILATLVSFPILAQNPPRGGPSGGGLPSGTGPVCVTSGTGGICGASSITPAQASIVVAAPYLEIGGNFYIPTDNMYLATKPSFSGWTTISGSATNTLQPNGNYAVYSTAVAWQSQTTYTGSAEVSFNTGEALSGSDVISGPFIYDSTNSKIYVCGYDLANRLASGYTWTYTGSGAPSGSSSGFYEVVSSSTIHLKLKVAAGSATCSYSIDGGATFYTTNTYTMLGTIAQMGLSTNGAVNLMSMVLQ